MANREEGIRGEGPYSSPEAFLEEFLEEEDELSLSEAKLLSPEFDESRQGWPLASQGGLETPSRGDDDLPSLSSDDLALLAPYEDLYGDEADEEILYEDEDEEPPLQNAPEKPLSLSLEEDTFEGEEDDEWSWDSLTPFAEELTGQAPSGGSLSLLDEDDYDPGVQEERASRQSSIVERAKEQEGAEDSWGDLEESLAEEDAFQPVSSKDDTSLSFTETFEDWGSTEAPEVSYEDKAQDPFDDEEDPETDDEPEETSVAEGKAKPRGFKGKLAELKAAAAAEFRGEDYEPGKNPSEDEDAEEAPEDEEATSKRPLPPAVSKAGGVLTWPYRKVLGLLTSLLGGVFGILGKIPGVGRFVALIGTPLVTLVLANLILFLILFKILSWSHASALPGDSTLSLPDNGALTLSGVTYSSETSTASGTLSNTGEVNAEGRAVFTVYSTQLKKPLSLLKPAPEVTCEGALEKLSIGEIRTVKVKCPPPQGLFPAAGGTLREE